MHFTRSSGNSRLTGNFAAGLTWARFHSKIVSTKPTTSDFIKLFDG